MSCAKSQPLNPPYSKANASLYGLVCGYASHVRARKLITVIDFRAFADDSGSELSPERPLVIAAYMLPATHWIAFADEWHAVLQREPKIEYLKMSEAESRTGQFAGFYPEFVELKLNELTAVIVKYRPYAMYCWIRRSDYDAYFRGHVPAEIDNPYFITMQGLIELSLMVQERYGFAGPVFFVFDEQRGIQKQIAESYDYAKQQAHPQIQRCSVLLLSSRMMFQQIRFRPLTCWRGICAEN